MAIQQVSPVALAGTAHDSAQSNAQQIPVKQVSPVATPASAPAMLAVSVDKCVDLDSCVRVMLAAAKSENLSLAMAAMQRLNDLPKPARGDTQTARKLNQLGLTALHGNDLPGAILQFSHARAADPGDVEVVGNLMYAYLQNHNYINAADLAMQGFLLDSKSANLWFLYSTALQKQERVADGLAALWLAWQFSTDRTKMLALIDSKLSEESDAQTPRNCTRQLFQASGDSV